MKFVSSYSFGKDSALSLFRMIKAGHEPVCLITTVNEDAGRSWFHGVDLDLMDSVSECLGIPLIKCFCKGDNYHTEFEKSLVKARELGAEACVFGDIDIDGHLEWNRERCKNAGLECIMPLWKESRESVVYEIIDSGFKAVIKCIQNTVLNEPLLGQTLDRKIIDSIRETEADICGENGEYHTLTFDGPIFKRPVDIRIGEVLTLGSHSVINITL